MPDEIEVTESQKPETLSLKTLDARLQQLESPGFTPLGPMAMQTAQELIAESEGAYGERLLALVGRYMESMIEPRMRMSVPDEGRPGDTSKRMLRAALFLAQMTLAEVDAVMEQRARIRELEAAGAATQGEAAP